MDCLLVHQPENSRLYDFFLYLNHFGNSEYHIPFSTRSIAVTSRTSASNQPEVHLAVRDATQKCPHFREL